MSPRLAFAVEVAVKAGRSTLPHFQTGTAVELKSDATPVTIADREAERLIRSELKARYPKEAVLGEEEGQVGAGSSRWVLDPIDGTKSFISGVPLYATLLAFEEGGDPILGVCYFPALNELLYAETGRGATWNGRPARVSETPSLEGSVVVSGSMASMTKAGRSEGFRRIEAKTMASRTWSDAYGHALVATGRVAAMVDPIVARWDISAMAVIVREAGGRFTDFKGGDGLVGEALSSNGLVHHELLEAFRR
ncbi:MAG TPA: inositol monophosphatase family protein [Fimbriimonadaceae bacterium]|nr:inositol monophosphatase family protein [Fimbriimonadaceae bacterium]